MKRTCLYALAAVVAVLFIVSAQAQYPDCGQVCTPFVSCETKCAADPGKGEGEATTCGEYGICDGCTLSGAAMASAAPFSTEAPPLDLEPPAATPASPCTAQCTYGPNQVCYGNPCSAVNQACPGQTGYCWSASEGYKFCDSCQTECTAGCDFGDPPPSGCTCEECCLNAGHFGGDLGPGGTCDCFE